ncbi:MAG: OmpA family protein [Bacteroidota bacterium]|nr:OmpA family protein [Bacteroidota bacterium]
MHRKTPLVLFLFFLSFISKSQNITDFKVGTKATSFFLNNSETSFHSRIFSKLNKLVFIQVWDSNADSVKSELINGQKLYKQYSLQHFKRGVEFELVTIATGTNFSNWKKVLGQYNIQNAQNFISFDYYWDLYLKNYYINKIPFSMFIDETGTIVMIEPKYEEVNDYLNKNWIENPTNVISGKVMVGTKSLAPLPYRKLYVTNKEKDTIQTVITSGNGSFIIKNAFPKSELSINISKYPEISGTDMVFLTSTKGRVIGSFNKTPGGLSYKFLNKDVFVLKPVEEVDQIITPTGFKNNMFYRYFLFNNNETILEDTCKQKIDVVIDKLKENPSYRVEIQSHTDVTGNPQNNLSLSKTRAKVISDYIVSKGIDKKRVLSVGLGDKFPIIKCEDGNCTPGEVLLNRRTEFKLLKQ